MSGVGETIWRQRRKNIGDSREIADAGRYYDSPRKHAFTCLETDVETVITSRHTADKHLFQVGDKLLLEPLTVLRERRVFDGLEILQPARATILRERVLTL